MAEADDRHLATTAAPGKFALMIVVGATAAAWFWIRQGEESLQRRTAARLCPRSGNPEE